MKSNIQTIVDFVSSQMDGESVPPGGSKALAQLENAVREVHKHQSTQELQMLGLHVIGAVINRVSSNIQAQATLGKFIRGDYAD